MCLFTGLKVSLSLSLYIYIYYIYVDMYIHINEIIFRLSEMESIQELPRNVDLEATPNTYSYASPQALQQVSWPRVTQIRSLRASEGKTWIFSIVDFPQIWICGHAETVPRHISRFQR